MLKGGHGASVAVSEWQAKNPDIKHFTAPYAAHNKSEHHPPTTANAHINLIRQCEGFILRAFQLLHPDIYTDNPLKPEAALVNN